MVMPPRVVFWGGGDGRCGQMGLLFGHIREIATHKKVMNADEIDSASEEQMEISKQIIGQHFLEPCSEFCRF